MKNNRRRNRNKKKLLEQVPSRVDGQGSPRGGFSSATGERSADLPGPKPQACRRNPSGNSRSGNRTENTPSQTITVNQMDFVLKKSNFAHDKKVDDYLITR